MAKTTATFELAHELNMSKVAKQYRTLEQAISQNYQNESALANILMSLPAHIYWKNKDGVILGSNERHALTFGLKSSREFIGKTAFDFVDATSAEKIRESDMKVISTGNTELIEESAAIQGDTRYFITHKAPFIDPNTKEAVGVLCVCIDITKQKVLEEQLAKQAVELKETLDELSEKKSKLQEALITVTDQKSELEKALELRDRILRNVSHEVRTPITVMSTTMYGVLGLWNKMTDAGKLDEFKNIMKSMDEFQDFAIGMLDISKLRSGTEDLECTKNDLIKLARDVIDELSRERKHISLVADKNLNLVANCDRLKLRQVFRSLIGNAMKFSEPQTPITVTISACSDEASQDLLQVSVTDQGVGVPEDEKYAIFDTFHESKRTRCYSGGTGLGLSIAREIIDAHGGKIWAQPNEVGTTFIFTLPRNMTVQFENKTAELLKENAELKKALDAALKSR